MAEMGAVEGKELKHRWHVFGKLVTNDGERIAVGCEEHGCVMYEEEILERLNDSEDQKEAIQKIHDFVQDAGYVAEAWGEDVVDFVIGRLRSREREVERSRKGLRLLRGIVEDVKQEKTKAEVIRDRLKENYVALLPEYNRLVEERNKLKIERDLLMELFDVEEIRHLEK